MKAITFDFWNTIACEPPGTMAEARQRAMAAACEACDIEVEAQLLASSLEEVASSYQRSWSGGTHFHPREGAEMLVRALGVEGAAQEMVAEAFLTAGRGASLELSPDIRPCLGHRSSKRPSTRLAPSPPRRCTSATCAAPTSRGRGGLG